MNSTKKILSIFGFFILPIIIYYIFVYDTSGLKYLPVYGHRDLKITTVDGNLITDTIYHTIPDFEFTDQTNKIITQKDFDTVIYVADFFFTTCRSICPVMTGNLEKIQEYFKNYNGLKLLSHTVNPEKDSVQVLAEYAAAKGADNEKWHFVTGAKEDIYQIARKGYMIDANQGDGGPDDFIHSQMFVLIDKQKRIRGYYDGTNEDIADQLIHDIKALIIEYAHKEKKDDFAQR